ncbi:hypothetical protein VTK26DRAFT_1216 [Humicola hyalothermophila]
MPTAQSWTPTSALMFDSNPIPPNRHNEFIDRQPVMCKSTKSGVLLEGHPRATEEGFDIATSHFHSVADLSVNRARSGTDPDIDLETTASESNHADPGSVAWGCGQRMAHGGFTSSVPRLASPMTEHGEHQAARSCGEGKTGPRLQDRPANCRLSGIEKDTVSEPKLACTTATTPASPLDNMKPARSIPAKHAPKKGLANTRLEIDQHLCPTDIPFSESTNGTHYPQGREPSASPNARRSPALEADCDLSPGIAGRNDTLALALLESLGLVSPNTPGAKCSASERQIAHSAAAIGSTKVW